MDRSPSYVFMKSFSSIKDHCEFKAIKTAIVSMALIFVFEKKRDCEEDLFVAAKEEPSDHEIDREIDLQPTPSPTEFSAMLKNQEKSICKRCKVRCYEFAFSFNSSL